MADLYENNMYKQAQKNIVRTWIIVLLFTAVVLAIAYGLYLYYGQAYIIAIALGVALVSNISSYFFSEKIALSSSGAVKASRDNPRDLRLIRMVENMAITAGVPTPGVYVINDPSPNAFATGRNPEHASVAFTTGILEVLSDTELEGVVAHELSHIKNRDILVGTIVVIMIGFVALLADMFIRLGVSGRRSSEGGPAAGILVIALLVFAVLSPVIGKLIQSAVSRKREYLADASGVLLTRYPEGLAQALIKINQYSRPLQRASQATSHLFIANPYGVKQSFTDNLKNMFSTHPPMDKRVKALLGKQGDSLLEQANTSQHE